jgi:predicted ATPase
LLTNYRPEYRPEWGTKTYYTQLRLTPLGREEAEELLTALLGTDPSLTALRQLILEKTEGTPFFMEEVVQTLREEGVLSADPAVEATRAVPLPTALHIPTTVQGVLAARIDRLAAEEKALLQHLAVIGREFPLGLVRQVVTQPEEELYRLLSSLQSKEFLYEQPAFPEVEYTFKHALTQEVAYNSLLLERRKVLHEHVGQAIEEVYRGQLNEHYSELAHHYTRSENTEKAIEYLHLAGQQAVQRSANTEAITHLNAALALLLTRPDTPERTAQELTLQVALGPSLQATKGWAAPEVEHAYSRALELCQQVGETPQLFSALFGLQAFYTHRAKLQTARKLAEQGLALAQRVQDPALLLEACHMLGYNLLYLGELTLAREHSEQGIALYDPQHHSLAFLYGGDDPGVCCLCHRALALWALGYPDQAFKNVHDALTLAQRLSHPLSLALALIFAAILQQFRRERQTAQEWTDAAMTLSTEQGFPYFLAWGIILQGWALTEQGQGEGITQIHQGLAAYRATGAESFRPYHLALLAEGYRAAGQADEGLAAVAEALTGADKNDERFYEAELYRLKGMLTLQKLPVASSQLSVTNPPSPTPTPQAEAEECFLRAIDIARKQQAKSLELRAATSLARLWRQQGKKDEARALLAPVYQWFTEGFDTADLQDAKALLDELA